MKDTLKPGERFISIVFLIGALYLFVESLKIFLDSPSASSYGALPMGVSFVMVVCMLKVVLFEDIKKKTACESDNGKSAVASAAAYMLPKDVLLFILFTILYIVLLFLDVGFIISSFIFMLGCMLYLMPRDKKTLMINFLFTAVLLGFLYVAFKVAFRIVLP